MVNLSEYLPYLLPILASMLLLLIGIALFVRDETRLVANQTVGAIYRVAIKAAAEFQDDALRWLRSPAGIDYRKKLIVAAYRNLPERIGPFSTQVVKQWLTPEKFAELVEDAFIQMVLLAEKVDDPIKRPKRAEPIEVTE